MTVYIEYVLIDNFIIDYSLLKVALTLTGAPVSKRRLFLCGILGATVAVAFPLLDFNAVLTAVIKLLSGGLLVCLSAKFKSVKQGYKTGAIFLLLTFAVGGGIMAAFWLFGIDYGKEICTAVVFVPVLLLLKFSRSTISAIVKKREISALKKRCELVLKNGEKITGTGFVDTGNGLSFNGAPVIMANKDFATEAFAKCPRKIYKTVYATAGGLAETAVMEIESVTVFSEGSPHIVKRAYLGAAKGRISEDCDFLLNFDFFKEMEDDGDNREVEKVS